MKRQPGSGQPNNRWCEGKDGLGDSRQAIAQGSEKLASAQEVADGNGEDLEDRGGGFSDDVNDPAVSVDAPMTVTR